MLQIIWITCFVTILVSNNKGIYLKTIHLKPVTCQKVYPFKSKLTWLFIIEIN